MKICFRNFRYQFSQFKVVYEYTKAGRSLSGTEGAEAAMKADNICIFGNETVLEENKDVFDRMTRVMD